MGPFFMLFAAAGGSVALFNSATPGIVVTGMIFLFALAATIVGYRWRQREMQLWKQGRLCTGDVVEVWETSSGSGTSQRTQRYVKYRYQLPRGLFQATYQTTTLWDDAQRVWVVYDPEEPTHSIPKP